MAARHFVAGGAMGSLLAMALNTAVPDISKEEGRRHTAYHDVVKVLTVCDGHTGRDVVVKHVYSDAECDALTESDAGKAAQGILDVSPQLIFHPIVLASLISFTYNLGVGAYQKSTVARLVNSGNLVAACNLLPIYDRAGGVTLPGLLGRRAREKALCLSTLTPEGMPDAG